MIAAPARVAFREVSSSDPTVAAWAQRLLAQSPHFSHASDYLPGAWLGLYVEDRLLSAYGYTHCKNGVVAVEYALCEPSKAGRVALEALTLTCCDLWKGRVVRFHCEIANRKIRKLVERLGAKPVAYMYEIIPEGHHG